MHRRQVPFLHALAYALIGKAQTAHVDWQTHSGYQVDLARERLAEQALERDYTHILYIDDDIVPPLGLVDRMLGWRYAVVTGIYERRAGGLAQGLFVDHDSMRWNSLSWPPPGGEVAMISATGAGCLLIDTRVFRRMSRPWFHYSAEGSEDMYFCMKLAHELLIPILCDTTIRCGHEAGGGLLLPGGERTQAASPVPQPQ